MRTTSHQKKVRRQQNEREGKLFASCSPNHGMLRLLEEVVKNVDSYMVQHDDSLRLS
ncbi:GM22878 [Drosophila sechellia]|uniref:GM22878 n=1 Tax=Drosophila sechellia TaxID=7238 RepID=B4I6N4_DROSE|nr:GM22878 [Drosophila sechellia]